MCLLILPIFPTFNYYVMCVVEEETRESVSGMPNANFNRVGEEEASLVLVNAGMVKCVCMLRLVLLFMNYLGHFSNGMKELGDDSKEKTSVFIFKADLHR